MMRSLAFSHLGIEIPARGFGTFQIPPKATGITHAQDNPAQLMPARDEP